MGKVTRLRPCPCSVELPIITIIAMWLPLRGQQNTLGHHWPVSPPWGLCVDQEVPETLAGLLWAPGLLALPGIAALSLQGRCWGVARGCWGAVLPLRCGRGSREQLLTDGQHEERKDAHHVPQAHVPEHHRLLGQRGRLGLGRGRAGLWVRREGVSPAEASRLGPG